ncbi:carbohydrate deacetylase [Vibrio paucivorans]
MKLIMNADDFGLTESVNNAIVDCFKAGIVQSTTVMMNQPGTQHAAELYRAGKVTNVGLHFTVTAGKPLLPAEQVASLVDENGDFLAKSVLLKKTDVCPKEVYNELQAQYDAALKAGFKLTHIDTHHFGGIYPALKQAFIQFANTVQIPVRRVDSIVAGQDPLNVKTPDVFELGFFNNGATMEHLKAILSAYKSQIPSGSVELMCHPANQVTEELCSLTGYTDKRLEELQILTSPELKHWLEVEKIQCISFNDL